MNRTVFIIVLLLILSNSVLFGQGLPPRWVDQSVRDYLYSNDSFFTGFVSEKVSGDIQGLADKLRTDAQKSLSENIRVKITSEVQSADKSVRVDGKERVSSMYSSDVRSSSNVEIVGMKTESYYDKSANIIYAFAYVTKNELIGYYKSSLTINIGQIESFVKTAQNLEESQEKAKARQQLEVAKPILEKVYYAQDLLAAIDSNVSAEDLQQTKTESLYNQLTQMYARLAQGVYVYVESDEDLLGVNVSIIADKLMGILAKRGCSFVDDSDYADFILRLNATTRKIGNENASIVFCYGDVTVEMYSNNKQKIIYRDEISQKGGGNSHERAGRKAFENAVTLIEDKILAWIE